MITLTIEMEHYWNMAEKSYLSNTKTFQLESFLHSGRPFFAFSVNTILINEIMYPIDIQRFTNNESKTFFVSSRYMYWHAQQ